MHLVRLAWVRQSHYSLLQKAKTKQAAEMYAHSNHFYVQVLACIWLITVLDHSARVGLL